MQIIKSSNEVRTFRDIKTVVAQLGDEVRGRHSKFVKIRGCFKVYLPPMYLAILIVYAKYNVILGHGLIALNKYIVHFNLQV